MKDFFYNALFILATLFAVIGVMWTGSKVLDGIKAVNDFYERDQWQEYRINVLTKQVQSLQCDVYVLQVGKEAVENSPWYTFSCPKSIITN